MKPFTPSHTLAVAIITTTLLGPAALWAVEQGGVRVDTNRQIVVFALSGLQLTGQGEQGTKTLQFLDALPEGSRLTTDESTTADLLIGNRAVVTMGNDTAFQLLAVSPEQTTIQVTKGMVRVAAASSALGPQGVVTVRTPTGQLQTRGGIVRVWVEAPVGKAEPVPTGQGKAYPASYVSARMAAVTSANGELIQVDEGTAEVLGAGGKPVTLQAGQRVTVQAGQAGVVGEGNKPDSLRPGVVATQGHSQTPKEGREYLVALQVDQATKLGKALTGAAETGNDASEKKKDTKNVINGATGGVVLASSNSLVSSLFGGGSASNPTTGGTIVDRTGAGYGGHNSNGFTQFVSDRLDLPGNGSESTLLVFTRKDPIKPFALNDQPCGSENCFIRGSNGVTPIANFKEFRALPSIPSSFRVDKELVLVGGATNEGHGGAPPFETLMVRGAAPQEGVTEFTNKANTTIGDPARANGLYLSDRQPDFIGGPAPKQIVAANSNFVVESRSDSSSNISPIFGGTLGQFSNKADGLVHHPSSAGRLGASDFGRSFVDGAITATGANVVLTGGVTLDQMTTATIGTTTATDTYLKALTTDLGRTFSGSMLSVISGPNNTPTSLRMQDQMLGVYDGSIVKSDGGNKALLSVLDAKLKGPGSSIPLIDIAAGTHFDRDGKATAGTPSSVTVTSAIVTRSTIQLDGALLEASAPLIALTGIDKDLRANMTTTNHFADLAGNQAQSLNLNGVLVSLNASKLSINSGHLLNLNNATAAISGYLFSLTNGSGLDIKDGALFSLNDGSSLTLTGNGLGVFGSGSNTLTIENNLCTGPCGTLVNSANQPITTLDGIPLKVSGVTQDVVLPNGFNAFALAPGAMAANAKIDIDANDALFHLDPTSTLIINGTQVK